MHSPARPAHPAGARWRRGWCRAASYEVARVVGDGFELVRSGLHDERRALVGCGGDVRLTVRLRDELLQLWPLARADGPGLGELLRSRRGDDAVVVHLLVLEAHRLEGLLGVVLAHPLDRKS